MLNFNVLLFDDFETLDAFGPVEVIGKLPKHYKLGYYSIGGGIVTSSQNVRVETLPYKNAGDDSVLLIPGGMGTRGLVDDISFIGEVRTAAQNAKYVLTVCTGAALLAKTGLLKNRRATTNKIAFDWVVSVDNSVNWIKRARWNNDGKFYTASGVSAGIDMTLGFISDIDGYQFAENTAKYIEYVWNKDKDNDPFTD